MEVQLRYRKLPGNYLLCIDTGEKYLLQCKDCSLREQINMLKLLNQRLKVSLEQLSSDFDIQRYKQHNEEIPNGQTENIQESFIKSNSIRTG